MPKRQLFTSHFGAVFTMIGLAVGLGNVWRFPYMMGKFGGSAFLFVYLIFTLLFALPALMAEMALGRETRKGPVGAFSKVFGQRLGTLVGYMLIFTILVAASYYLVVIANVLYTTFFSVFQGFKTENFALFEKQLANGGLQFGISLVTLIGSLYVLHRGLNKGLELLSKIFVPFFLVAILYLIFHAFSLENAKANMLAFLRPDFAALNPENIFAALGQTFFSLGLGGTLILIFGSYLQKDEKLPRLALLTAAGDVGAALLASLFIVPTVLAFGLNLASGPRLLFDTLPRLFHKMPGGQFIGSLFLVALSLVAILSLIAALEVVVGGLEDSKKLGWSRKKIISAVGIACAMIAFPCSLYPDLIGILDLIFGSGMMVLGSALAAIGLSRGLGKATTLNQIFTSEKLWWRHTYFFWIKWVVPGVLLMVLFGYIYSSV